MELLSVVVAADLAGVPLRDALRRRLKLSRSLYRRLWAADGVRVDGAACRPFEPLRAGQILTLTLATPSRVIPEEAPLDVPYEDSDVAVVAKPPGMVAHPTRGVATGTLAAALAHRFGGFHLVGRLDRETSGLVVVARHPLAAHRLAQALARGALRRTYRALVHGCPADPAGHIDAPIGRVPGQARRGVLPGGQPARTSYRVLRTLGDRSLVELSLETGRTHQIRVHMAHLGHPVVGDDRYGPEPREWPRLCLHAAEVAFPHPATGTIVQVRSRWPADLPDPGLTWGLPIEVES